MFSSITRKHIWMLHYKILCSRMPESFDRQLTAIQLLWRITNTILDEEFIDVSLKCTCWHPHFTFFNGPAFCAFMTFLEVNLVWSLKELVNQCLFGTFKWQAIKTKKETTQLVLFVALLPLQPNKAEKTLIIPRLTCCKFESRQCTMTHNNLSFIFNLARPADRENMCFT